MNKMSVFLDVDETKIDSIPAFVQVVNETYNTNIDYTQLKRYDFKDICPMLKDGELQDIFASDRFWEIVKIKEGCLEVLSKKENLERFEFIDVSIGNINNIYKKGLYIKNKFPMVQERIYIDNLDDSISKKRIQMQGSIFLDDHVNNLLSSNATYGVCFKEKVYPWNRGWYGYKVANWYEFDKLINYIWEFENRK